jgi:hypothetical protein
MATYAHQRLSALPHIKLPLEELAALYTDAATPLGAKEAAFPFLTLAYHRCVCVCARRVATLMKARGTLPGSTSEATPRRDARNTHPPTPSAPPQATPPAVCRCIAPPRLIGSDEAVAASFATGMYTAHMHEGR